jgi:hypothetical protein
VTAAPGGNDLVADVARQLVARTAPQELPLFRAVSDAYFRDPRTVLEPKGGRDDLLGFGVDAAMMLVTPVALEVAKSVVAFLVTQVRDAVEKEGSEAITGFVQRLFHRDNDDDPRTPPLTREQLDRVRELALEKAHQLKLPDAQASLLADSMVGSLAT